MRGVVCAGAEDTSDGRRGSARVKVEPWPSTDQTRTVDVHVHWLRSAIEPEPGRPSIVQTVRGVGYVLRRGATP